MKYIANHFMTVNGKFVTRGEIFDAEYSAEQEERLKRLGAIREADAPSFSPETVPEETREDREEAEEDVSAPDTVEKEEQAEEDLEPVEETLKIDPLDAVTPAETEETKKGRKEK